MIFVFQQVNRVMFSMGIADLLTGLILVPQVYRESLINPNEISTQGNSSIDEIPTQGNSSIDEIPTQGNSTIEDHYFDTAFCRLLTAGTWLSVTTSIYLFTIVSIGRYMAASHEELYEKHFKAATAYVSIIPCWLLGLVQAVPLLTDWNSRQVSDYTTCSLPIHSDEWIEGSAVTVFGIPTLIIVICYGLILLKVWQDAEERKSDGIIMTFVLSMLTLAFLLCWWPALIYLAVKWDSDRDSRAVYFGSLNSLINPLLFMGLNAKLRKKVKEFFQNFAAFCRGEAAGCRLRRNNSEPEPEVHLGEPDYFKMDD